MTPRVLFLTSNGAGLGHLTRSLAVARRLDPGIGTVVFTLSQAAPIVTGLGVPTEYLLSAGYAGTDRRAWNDLYAHRLERLLAEYDPAVVSFDGTYPYAGLMRVVHDHPERTWIWNRRAMWRPGRGERNLEFAEEFDLVVEPGELAEDRDQGVTVAYRDQVVRVGPIVYTRAEELLSREQACERFDLDAGRTNVLVQLGAGNINDAASTAGIVTRRLLADPDVTVVATLSPIAHEHPELPEGVRTITAYPLAPAFRAFDGAVAASGYNSFHELLHFRVPSLFVPNVDTALDDQASRAAWARDGGYALEAREADPVTLGQAAGELLDAGRRAELLRRMETLSATNGAHRAAERFSEAVSLVSTV